MKLTKKSVQHDLDMLPENFKTKDLDELIKGYVKEKADASELRKYVLSGRSFSRIYFYVSLKQIKNANERLDFIDKNLLFQDWWSTDQLIGLINSADFSKALDYSKKYIVSDDPFVRRMGYVMFISKLGHGHAAELLPLLKDDEHYYVQMGEAWLIAELSISQAEFVFTWMKTNGLEYNINGKAIQKICDSYRITDEWKEKFKLLKPTLK